MLESVDPSGNVVTVELLLDSYVPSPEELELEFVLPVLVIEGLLMSFMEVELLASEDEVVSPFSSKLAIVVTVLSPFTIVMISSEESEYVPVRDPVAELVLLNCVEMPP